MHPFWSHPVSSARVPLLPSSRPDSGGLRVQELFTQDEYEDEAAALATRLIKKARAYGIILTLLAQNPDAPSLPSSVSSSVGTRLCLAVMDWRANNNVLEVVYRH